MPARRLHHRPEFCQRAQGQRFGKISEKWSLLESKQKKLLKLMVKQSNRSANAKQANEILLLPREKCKLTVSYEYHQSIERSWLPFHMRVQLKHAELRTVAESCAKTSSGLGVTHVLRGRLHPGLVGLWKLVFAPSTNVTLWKWRNVQQTKMIHQLTWDHVKSCSLACKSFAINHSSSSLNKCWSNLFFFFLPLYWRKKGEQPA